MPDSEANVSANTSSSTSADVSSNISANTSSDISGNISQNISSNISDNGEHHVGFSDKPVVGTENETRSQDRQELPQEVAQAAQPQYYNDTEFMQAINSNSLDQTKISPAQAQFLSNQRAAYMAEEQAKRNRAEQWQRMEQEAQQRRVQSMASLNDYAHQAALRAIKIAPENFKDIEYMANSDELKQAYSQAYQQAYADGAYQIALQNVQREQQEQQFRNGMMEISNFVQGEQKAEPHHKEIMELMNTEMKKMPYEEAQPVVHAWNNISNGICSAYELQTIRSYYDHCKKKVYQQGANVTKVPQRTTVPMVERTGQPNPQTANQPMDWNKLKGASEYDRTQAIRQYIKNYL